MHIEPGYLAQSKILLANVAAIGVCAAYLPALLKRPVLWLRTLLAALFFSVFMQSFHLPVGPSELHFVGAMPIYLVLGFLPTLFGVALGLLWQGLLFEPQDLLHLSVNALSLMAPLLVLHHTMGRRLASGDLSLTQLLKLDGAYYAGVTLMVGFWLSQGAQVATFGQWATFAASYVGVVALEPVFTLLVVKGLAMVRSRRWAQLCFDARCLRAA